MHSARPISFGFGIFAPSGHWRRGSIARTSRRRNVTASWTIAGETVRGQRTPPSFAQCPHSPAAGSLSSSPRNAIRQVSVSTYSRIDASSRCRASSTAATHASSCSHGSPVR